MQHYTPQKGLIVGAGAGLSAAVARLLAKDGVEVSLAARTPDDLSDLCEELSAKAYACDAAKRDDVAGLFAALDADGRTPDFVLYNPSARSRGPFVELDPDEVQNAIMVSA